MERLHLMRKRKWIVAMALFGVSSYGTYKLYHLPSVTRKRKKLFKLFVALISLAETVSDSSDVISIVSRDLKQFLQSDSDEIPKSLKQLSKIALSNEFSESVATVTESVSLGLLKFYKRKEVEIEHNSSKSSLSDRFMDKIMSTAAGTGFVSVIIGNFAKNLVQELLNVESSSSDLPNWLNLAISNEKCKPLIVDCVQTFVSSAVAVYLDKTKTINIYDELFSSITDPRHQTEVKDLLVSLCKGAIETLVKTSHQVLTTTSSSKSDPAKSIASTVPIDRKFVVDLTGRVTFETVRSVLEFVWLKVRRRVEMVHEKAVGNGLEIVRFVDAKSSVIVTLCIAFYLHVLGNNRVLVSL